MGNNACKNLGGENEDNMESQLGINDTVLRDIKSSVQNTINEHRQASSQSVKTRQHIKLVEHPDYSENILAPQYRKELIDPPSLLNIIGITSRKNCGFQYGCAPILEQSTQVKLYTFNSTLKDESETIYENITSMLASQTDTNLTGANKGLKSINDTINEARETGVANIDQILTSFQAKNVDDEKIMEIEYRTPRLCEDPCGAKRGPILTQDATIEVVTEDIVSTTINILKERISVNEMDVQNTVSDVSMACIMQILCCMVCCLTCAGLVYYMLNTMGGAIGEGVNMYAQSKIKPAASGGGKRGYKKSR